VWSSDNDEIAFRWDGDDTRPRGIYRKRIGDGSETLVRPGQGEDDYACDWTADGRYLVVTTGPMLVSPENDLIAVPLDGGPEIPLVVEPGPQHSGQVSPDGRWLAYVDALPRSKVFVVPFGPAWPDGRSGERWLVSEKQSSYMPRWSPLGDELYYMTASGTLHAVDVEPGGETFSFSAPRPLFQLSWDRSRSYDVAPPFESDPDAFGRFLFVDSEESPEGPISILLNWKSVLSAESR
jgi:Tol biopolymer transport system component